MTFPEASERVSIAAAALAGLPKHHQHFLTCLETSMVEREDCGSLAIAGGKVTAECLGVHLDMEHRPIAVEGRISAFEYTFSAIFEAERLRVLTLYHHVAREALYTDATMKAALSQVNNLYLARFIITTLAAALLESAVFAPRA